MNMIVCLKQIQDPEIPPAKFKVDANTNKVIAPEGVPPVINPFDEQAIEAALRIKDSKGECKITAITVGGGKSRDILKHAMSMGSDEAYIVDDPAVEDSDSFAKAYILAQAIQKLGPYDLILCGRQAADWDEGQVGAVLAETLGIPVITLARKVEAIDGGVRVERVTLDGYEIVDAPLPALVTISNELGQPRLPTGMGIIMAARKKINEWTAKDIDVDLSRVGPEAARTKILKLFIPVRAGECEFMPGENTAEAATNLALKLRETKLI